MSIIANLKLAHAAIVNDFAKKLIKPDDMDAGKLGPRLNLMAVDALTQGIGTQAWSDYMSLFANNEDELAQLIDPERAKDPTMPWLKQSRAYIVSNAICDIGTNGETGRNVNTLIDVSNGEADDAFIAERKLKFPPLV
jgi:hypothetical protein